MNSLPQPSPPVPAALAVSVPRDGAIALGWRAAPEVASRLLVERTGAKPGMMTVALARGQEQFVIENLGRSQRYRVGLLLSAAGESRFSGFWSVTPQPRLPPELNSGAALPAIAALLRPVAMPQDRRVSLFWGIGPGFVTAVELRVQQGGRELLHTRLEPEQRSAVLAAERFPDLVNDDLVEVTLTPMLATLRGASCGLRLVPAPAGCERPANRALPQDALIYATPAVGDELDVFGDRQGDGVAVGTPRILCGLCQADVRWRGYELYCSGCAAEFVPNGFGAYLAVRQLRFGTCRCCLPRKLLIARPGEEDPVCAHTGKLHLRGTGPGAYVLVDELPFGLCQCCRPRQRLLERDAAVRCQRSGKAHQASEGAYVLVDAAPVLDASLIDELLDRGLAELNSRGVSRAHETSEQPKKRRRAS